MARNIHRIGGGSIANLRLKDREAKLDQPGISVLKAESAKEIVEQVRRAFPRARDLHAAAKVIGSTTEELIRVAGFDIIHAGSKLLPNHHRIIHRDGAMGFTDENLAKLSNAFLDCTIDDESSISQ